MNIIKLIFANVSIVCLFICMTVFSVPVAALAMDLGAFYFPGWHSQKGNWKDIKGLPGSRSPNIPWPDREALLGYYAEEDVRIAEQHIEWASQYGIKFFAYDWYWNGKVTEMNHAIENYLKASNNSKMKFSILWANHSDVPRNLKEFDDMVIYWIKNYLNHPQFYKKNRKPLVFVFSIGHLERAAQKIEWRVDAMLKRADKAARDSGLPGIFFVATTNLQPDDTLDAKLSVQGFSAYTGWNYAASKDKSAVADYQSMVDTYIGFYKAASLRKGILPYIVPASPGYDARPHGRYAIVRTNPTPEKFEQMLAGAKQLIDSKKSGIMDIIMIEAWNEFGEGSYIEPSKKWGFEYLNITKKFNSSFPQKNTH